jgi:hypothetical protein
MAMANGPFFSEWHAAFGCLQRLRDDTWHEQISPLKPTNPAASVAGTQAGERAVKRRRTRTPPAADQGQIDDEELSLRAAQGKRCILTTSCGKHHIYSIDSYSAVLKLSPGKLWPH